MSSTTGRVPLMAAPDGHRHHGLLGDRRVAHALGAEVRVQALGHAEHASAVAPDRDVLAHQEHAASRGISSRSASFSAAL